MKAKDYTNLVFGQLTVIKEVLPRTRPRKWTCNCNCGNTIDVLQTSLQSGGTKSCGCLRKETISKLKTKHGDSQTSLYQRWKSMHQRCSNPNNPNYQYYGEKGIRVCDEWSNYQSFKDWAINNDYSESFEIDRIDGNKDYSPNNCRWIDKINQCRNRQLKQTNTSGFTGVSFHKQKQKYVSYISVNKQFIEIGLFDSAIEAHEARKQYISINNLQNFI